MNSVLSSSVVKCVIMFLFKTKFTMTWLIHKYIYFFFFFLFFFSDLVRRNVIADNTDRLCIQSFRCFLTNFYFGECIKSVFIFKWANVIQILMKCCFADNFLIEWAIKHYGTAFTLFQFLFVFFFFFFVRFSNDSMNNEMNSFYMWFYVSFFYLFVILYFPFIKRFNTSVILLSVLFRFVIFFFYSVFSQICSFS